MDLNGDGIKDIISGGGGAVYMFLGMPDGTFAERQELLNPNYGIPGEDLLYDPYEFQRDPGIFSTFVTFTVDWDRDGNIDLLLGDRRGYVYFFPSESSSELQFGLPLRLEADGEPVVAFHGYAAPSVADWDGDGRHDLILGCGAGNVLFYRNTSDHGLPALTTPVELVPVSGAFVIDHSNYDPDEDRGGHAIPNTADWNGDGLNDLLVGTHRRIKAEQRNLTLPQLAEVDRAWAIHNEATINYRRLVNPVLERVQKEMDLSSDDMAQLRGKYLIEFHMKVQEALMLEDNYLTLVEEMRNTYAETQKYAPEEVFHGWVWVYLRKPAG